MNAREAVCAEIMAIMRTYHEQEESPRGIGTPGGLEHMGDVWNLFLKWEDLLGGSGGVKNTKKKRSVLECDCGREKHTYLDCGVPLPRSVLAARSYVMQDWRLARESRKRK